MPNSATSDTEPSGEDDALLDELARIVADEAPPGRTMWLLFVNGDSRLLSVATLIEGMPAQADRHNIGNLCSLIRQVLEAVSEAECAVLLIEREGPSRIEASDLAWSGALHEAAGRTGVPLRTYVAAGGIVQPLPERRPLAEPG